MTINAEIASGVALSRRLADSPWFNAVWFQALWVSTVLGRDSLLPVALALLGLHVWLVRGDSGGELRYLVFVGATGIAIDAVLSATGVYRFSGGALVPLWLCCLWLGFAAALRRSLAWLARRPVWTVLAGALAFPLNYWAGQRLGAVEFGFSLSVTLVLLAAIWGLALPLMLRLGATLDLRDAWRRS